MPELTRSEIDVFLSQSIIGRIATVRPDNRPHVMPIWFVWDGQCLFMETPPTFVKAKNLKINPHCAVAIDTTEGGLRFKAVILEGKIELIYDHAFVHEMVTRIYSKYLGVEGAQSPTPQKMIHSEHLIIKLSPEKIITWDYSRDGIGPISRIFEE